MAPIKKLVVSEAEKSSFDLLKKSAADDCIMPNDISGASNIILLENKLSKPLSVGVKYRGSVNNGISRNETPLEKKLVNMYVATDL